MLDHALSCAIVGSPATVRSGLDDFVRRTGADELMVTAQVFDHKARLQLRSRSWPKHIASCRRRRKARLLFSRPRTIPGPRGRHLGIPGSTVGLQVVVRTPDAPRRALFFHPANPDDDGFGFASPTPE